MEKKTLKLFMLAASVLSLAACGGNQPAGSGEQELTGTAAAVAAASKMTYEELEAAAKAEMEASTSTFKVLGLTSVLKKAVEALVNQYDWLNADATYVKNDYKDYTLLQALEPAEDTYVADFALTQDERSIADYTKTGILHNYVPSDYEAIGLSEADTMPLKGIHFNKIFWTNTNYKGPELKNIWQMAGDPTDEGHIAKVSFQSPVTEQINMSFLLSCMASENQARIEAAYKSYYGKAWEKSDKYESAGRQWVEEFIANIKRKDSDGNQIGRFHDSDGSCMKQYQIDGDWEANYVYFGAYSKMKDAAGKYYAFKEGMDESWKEPEGTKIDSGKKDADGNVIYTDVSGKVKAIHTVKWDYNVEGFDGYFYTMDSQIVNNAEHPYMACLFARYMLEGSFYKSAIYSSTTPNEDGTKGNQYGYYYPGEMPAYSATETKPVSNSYDRSKAEWKACSLVEDYSYLKTVRPSRVAYFQGLINA